MNRQSSLLLSSERNTDEENRTFPSLVVLPIATLNIACFEGHKNLPAFVVMSETQVVFSKPGKYLSSPFKSLYIWRITIKNIYCKILLSYSHINLFHTVITIIPKHAFKNVWMPCERVFIRMSFIKNKFMKTIGFENVTRNRYFLFLPFALLLSVSLFCVYSECLQQILCK